MTSENTQLTSAFGYNTSRMVFSKPQAGTIPNSVPPIAYSRIMIGTKNKDGTVGELIIPTIDPDRQYLPDGSDKPELFSFGLCENNGPDGKQNGHVMPICLWNRNGATTHEKAWTDTFMKIVEACKDYILANKRELKKFDLERGDLKSLNKILYWKRDKESGEIVKDVGPTLYAKVISSKKQGKFMTQFFTYRGEPLDAQTLMNRYCYGRFAVKFESIFIGNKISLQIKLYEVEARFADTGMKRLLSRPTQSDVLPTAFHRDDSDVEDNVNETNSLKSDTEEPEVSVPEPEPVSLQPKKVVRKVKTVLRRGGGDDE